MLMIFNVLLNSADVAKVFSLLFGARYARDFSCTVRDPSTSGVASTCFEAIRKLVQARGEGEEAGEAPKTLQGQMAGAQRNS